MSTAYLLITHGSRDPRPQASVNRLAQIVRDQIDQSGLGAFSIGASAHQRHLVGVVDSGNSGKPGVIQSTSHRSTEQRAHSRLLKRPRTPVPLSEPAIVGSAVLELSPLSLREQIYAFGRRVRAAGIKRVMLLPLFLMKGVHVMDDIPDEVTAARSLLGSSVELILCPHIGSHTNMQNLLATKLSTMPAKGRLLIAHGSRRPKGNREIDALAKSLETTAAYWATSPDLETQVISLMQQGCQAITILPYFLFSGGITDAVTHLTEELAERFPKVNFRMLPPLGATQELSSLIVDLAWSEKEKLSTQYRKYA